MSRYAAEVRSAVLSSYVEDIRALRERGLTVASVARRLSMSERTVYRVLAALREEADN